VKTPAQQKLQSEVDASVRAFAQRIAEQPGGATGIPKPPVIEVSESEFEPGKFIAEAGATSNDAISRGQDGGGDGSSGEHFYETVTGAINGVPATLVVDTDGSGWTTV
jgi:hypothetical protein